LIGIVVVAVAAHLAGRAQAIEAWQTAVDYQKLLTTLGTATPPGTGVSLSQVEAYELNTTFYMPDANNVEFAAATDPLGQPVTFTDAHGANGSGFSNHATGVVFNIIGATQGLAKTTNAVTNYHADRWLNDILGTGNNEPQAQPYQVQNHSWVGTLNNVAGDIAALARFDYVIDKNDMTAVVGANNNNGNPSLGIPPNPALPHPPLLSHSYNAIVAGRSDSKHSRGMTTITYGQGRFRPDLVVDAPSTSVATARISSIAAVLRGVVAGTDADRSETMKSILMAGATKTEFASFVDPATGFVNPWDHNPTRPLDDLFGAGEANIYNSYLMTVGGKNAGNTSQPAAAVKSYGWDYQNRKSDSAVGDIYYNFEIPAGSTASELSIMLTWNIKTVDANPSPVTFSPSQSLSDLDLKLFDSSASFLGAVLDQSNSNVDNVEHIFRTSLGPGTYTLAVSGAAGWDYGLAWRMSTLFNAPSADFAGDGFVGGTDCLAWQLNVGKLVGATHAQGDADGDGDVDRDDLAVYTAAISVHPMLAGPGSGAAVQSGVASGVGGIHGVPEPATWALAVAAGVSFAAIARRRKLRH
jgi:hypothetical protein